MPSASPFMLLFYFSWSIELTLVYWICSSFNNTSVFSWIKLKKNFFASKMDFTKLVSIFYIFFSKLVFVYLFFKQKKPTSTCFSTWNLGYIQDWKESTYSLSTCCIFSYNVSHLTFRMFIVTHQCKKWPFKNLFTKKSI